MDFTKDYLEAIGYRPDRPKRLDLLHSFFINDNFSVRSYNPLLSSEDFDPSDLKRQFSQICNDFLEPLADTRTSLSLGFCSKMVYELNPFFRDNRVGKKAHVLHFPDDKVTKKVILVPYQTHGDTDLGNVVRKDAEVTLKLTLSQGMFLAMHTFSKLIDINPNLIIMTPAASAAFVNKGRLPELAEELDITLPRLLKMINFSCVSRVGHYLEEADASCALIATLQSTREIHDQRRRLSVIAKLLKPYVDMGAIPVLEKALIFEKYATPDFPC